MSGSNLGDLASAIRAIPPGRMLIAVTGAGISLASGIPTFRGTDPGAVWSKDVTELGTYRYFATDPAASWSWYLSRFDTLRDKQPNGGHFALTQLENWQKARGGGFLLVTQNVDCLHEQAGSKEMVKVHGSADRVRCDNEGKCELAAPKGSIARDAIDITQFLEDPVANNLPRCPRCASLVRQHVLWFDERYDQHNDYQIDRVLRALKRPGVTLFIGTSFSVGITDMILHSTLARNGRVFSIDPSGEAPHVAVSTICVRAEEALPELVTLLSST